MDNILNKIKAIDSEKMYKAISSFPEQIRKSYKIMENISFSRKESISDIIICGMGGSAIGGDLCKTLLYSSAVKLNIYVNRGYALPNWTSKSSLVIISSYSGNTEETVSCYNQCIEKNISPIVITTGGYLLDRAKSNNNVYIEVPKGYQPRAALGFSFSLIFLTLSHLKIIDSDYFFRDSLYTSLSIHNDRMFDDESPAFELASKIYNKYIVIYSSQMLESVAYRFRCQLAENSKIISSHFIFPEQNHNEIEAFQNSNVKDIVFIWLSDKDDDPRITNRMQITQNLFSNAGSHYSIEASSLPPNENSDRWTRILKMVSYVDWISYYCALFNETDPTPVNKIEKLKGLL